MAIETAVYIPDLVNTNPPGTDQASTLDDHIRLIKAVLLTTLANLSGAVTTTHTELNLLTGYTGVLPELGTVQDWTSQQYSGTATLVDGAGIDWNLDTEQTAEVILGGNRTLNAPTNMQDGGTYILRIVQDATGTRTLTFNAVFKFASGLAPTMTATANAVDLLSCTSDGTDMLCVINLDMK